MSILSILCFALCLLILATLLRKGSDVVSPARLFAILWILAIGLADLKLSAMQYRWTTEEWLRLAIAVGSFLAGCYIVFVANAHRRLLTVSEIRAVLSRAPLNERRFFAAIIIVFAAYAVSFAASYAIKGFVPLLTTQPSVMRTRFTVFGFGLVVHAAPAIMFFVTQYVVLVKGRGGRKLILTAVFLVTALSYFLLLQRFDYAIWAVASFVFLYYASRYVRLRTLSIPVAAFVALFLWIQSLRLVGHIENYIYYASRMRFDIAYAALTEPYMYVVANLENFARASTLLDRHTWGMSSFDFLFALSGLKHWAREYFAVADTPNIMGGYNTYSFFWTFFRDFGYPGIFLFPLALGAGLSALHVSLRTAPDLLRASMYALAVFVILISFFHNALAMLQFVFIALVVYAVHRKIR